MGDFYRGDDMLADLLNGIDDNIDLDSPVALEKQEKLQ